MSYNYQPLSKAATSMIKKYGKDYSFSSTTVGAFNAGTGKTTNTNVTYKKSACVFNLTEADNGGFAVVAGDRRMLAESYDYKVGDKVTIDSEVFRIVAVSPNKPSDTALVVNLQIRK